MGSSALRGLAFAKPVIVVGEKGFSEVFSPETADMFLYSGMYGLGCGATGGERLAEQLLGLAKDCDRLAMLGPFGREFVERHFALERVCGQLHRFLTATATSRASRVVRLVETIRTSAVYMRERRFLCPSRDRRPVDAVTDSDTATG